MGSKRAKPARPRHSMRQKASERPAEARTAAREFVTFMMIGFKRMTLVELQTKRVAMLRSVRRVEN